MAFDVYPDPATAAALGKPAFAPLKLARGEMMAAYVPMPQRAGPDPSQGNVSTCFIRIRVENDVSDSDVSPTVDLAACDPASGGFSPRRVEPALANSLANGVQLYDGVNQTSAAVAYYQGPAQNSVYLLKIVVEIVGSRFWMRLINENKVRCEYVWVVADSDEDSRQPWFIVHSLYEDHGPSDIAVTAYVGQGAALNSEIVRIENAGTGPVTIYGADPPLPAPFVLRGLPLTMAANSYSDALTVGLDRPIAAGAVGPTTHRLLTRDKSDAGPFGPRRIDRFNLLAKVGPDNVWAARKPLPTGRSSLGVVTNRYGVIYAIAGNDPQTQTPSNSFESYMVGADAWFPEDPAPTARLDFGIACGADGLIYAVGGSSGLPNGPQALSFNQAFDPETRRWRTLAPMPTPRAGLALVAVRDGLIYAIGGFAPGLNALGVVEAYDPRADAWVGKPPLMRPRGYFGAALGDDGRIYVTGGSSPPVRIAQTEAYDPAAGTWTPRASMSTARFGLAFASGKNGRLYAVGGSAAGGSEVHTEEYDPAADSWRTRADMPTPRMFFGLAAANTGRFYAVGGYPSQTVVEEYTP